MLRRGLWAIGLGLTCGIWSCGCQSTGAAIDGESRAPSFGVDRVPRQSEPEVDEADVGRRVAASEPESSDVDVPGRESAGPKGNLLTRLLPGRDKESPERKALPVSKRSAGGEDDESEDDDSLDF